MPSGQCWAIPTLMKMFIQAEEFFFQIIFLSIVIIAMGSGGPQLPPFLSTVHHKSPGATS